MANITETQLSANLTLARLETRKKTNTAVENITQISRRKGKLVTQSSDLEDKRTMCIRHLLEVLSMFTDV